MSNFMNTLNQTLDNEYNVSVTENGAVGYATTNHTLLDMNFKVASYRHKAENDIVTDFARALNEDFKYAIKWMFYVRDIRSGLGERRLFRILFAYVAKAYPEVAKKLLNLIAEYGRYDDLISLYTDETLKIDIAIIVGNTLATDLEKMSENKPVTLLAKWMPSCNTSSKETVNLAHKLMRDLGLTEKHYRKTLSALRKYIDVVECKMSANNWAEIKYEAVPSYANKNYRNAFLAHDEERRTKYLESLEKGETKINASTLFPHDVVHQYGYFRYGGTLRKDATIEALWKALPNIMVDNTLVVCDGSVSMECRVGTGDLRAIEVANALAIYTSEHNQGQFKNTFITFSSKPQFVTLKENDSLHNKLKVSYSYDDCSNTNIEATFDIILKAAIENNMTQDDMPKNLLIISDMEFDNAVGQYGYYRSVGYPEVNKKLFDTISDRYKAAGFKMPRLIFWNVNSRTNTIPVKENELGVALVSGFSVNVLKMVMSSELDPWKCLLNMLDVDRYEAVEKALKTT